VAARTAGGPADALTEHAGPPAPQRSRNPAGTGWPPAGILLRCQRLARKPRLLARDSTRSYRPASAGRHQRLRSRHLIDLEPTLHDETRRRAIGL
jgi:hypothetical protein